MTEVIETTEVLSVMANCEITEVVRRASTKGDNAGSEFLTGTFDKYPRKVNGKPTKMYMRFNCGIPSLYEKLENALATGERIHLVFDPIPNNYEKKDKSGNVVMVDGKVLQVFGEQYRILDIL
jgi:hypothetical protein